jgi:hypothetical protein
MGKHNRPYTGAPIPNRAPVELDDFGDPILSPESRAEIKEAPEEDHSGFGIAIAQMTATILAGLLARNHYVDKKTAVKHAIEYANILLNDLAKQP